MIWFIHSFYFLEKKLTHYPADSYILTVKKEIECILKSSEYRECQSSRCSIILPLCLSLRHSV